MTNVQTVLEEPLIARQIASQLNHEDCIRFACISKDERFQDSIMDFVRNSRFALDLQTFFMKWDEADDEYTDMMNHITDPWTFDNVIKERDEFFTNRVIELCDYLRKNWNYAVLSQTFLEFLHEKFIEMSDMYPECQLTCSTFIYDMYDDSL